MAMVKQFERLVQEFRWKNSDGSTYPVAKESLAKYIVFHEGKVKPQSIMLYLSALKKHEQLSLLERSEVCFHRSIVRMLKNIKHNYMYAAAKRSILITLPQLALLKS